MKKQKAKSIRFVFLLSPARFQGFYVLFRELIEGWSLLIGLEDSPLLVLWYKNIFGTPIYSVDFRNGMEAASHWKDDKEGWP
jgi:hypothetical protein